MVNDIISGLSERLSEVFGFEVFTEQVKQGLVPPCFIVACVGSSAIPVVKPRYLRQNLFSVTYFPEGGTDAKAECFGIQDKLFHTLEYIPVKRDMLRGTGLNGQFVDGAYVCTVNYNYFVREPLEADMMEALGAVNVAPAAGE